MYQICLLNLLLYSIKRLTTKGIERRDYQPYIVTLKKSFEKMQLKNSRNARHELSNKKLEKQIKAKNDMEEILRTPTFVNFQAKPP